MVCDLGYECELGFSDLSFLSLMGVPAKAAKAQAAAK